MQENGTLNPVRTLREPSRHTEQQAKNQQKNKSRNYHLLRQIGLRQDSIGHALVNQLTNRSTVEFTEGPADLYLSTLFLKTHSELEIQMFFTSERDRGMLSQTIFWSTGQDLTFTRFVNPR